MSRRSLSHLAASGIVFLLPTWFVQRSVADPVLFFAVAIAVVLLGSQPRLDLREASSRSAPDRMSALAILAAVIVSLAAASIERARGAHAAPAWTVAGLPLAGLGLGLRLWAIRALGRSFTSVVAIVPGQRVIRTGPYRWLRHPSYTGALVTVAGVAMALAGSTALVLALFLCIPAYAYRIAAEEAVLLREFGEEYEDYRTQTGSLFPSVRAWLAALTPPEALPPRARRSRRPGP